MSEVILYTTEDGATKVDLKLENGTVWLSQMQIAELFEATKQNISLHLKNIYADGELTSKATVKESLTVQSEGQREVQRKGGNLGHPYFRGLTLFENMTIKLFEHTR
jgi:hypothetical protein